MPESMAEFEAGSILGRTAVRPGASTLRALEPEPYPEGNERLSWEIDAVVYGERP